MAHCMWLSKQSIPMFDQMIDPEVMCSLTVIVRHSLVVGSLPLCAETQGATRVWRAGGMLWYRDPEELPLGNGNT